jgi:manganese-dependent inorganic pyrophosphatase
MDSIGSAVAFAEYKRRLDPGTEYVPVRLGELNPQTRWVLERAGAPEPKLLPHVHLRAGDVMQTNFPCIGEEDPIRAAGLAMARGDYDLVPIVGADGAISGVVTTRVLARRYIRESRATSTLREATHLKTIAEVLEGRLLTEGDPLLSGRVWVQSMEDVRSDRLERGDVVIVGDRPDVQKRLIELGAALVVISNNSEADGDVIALAREHGVAVIVSPLDSYVTARMITLAAPCREVMETDPPVASADDLLSDVSIQVQESHHGAAIVVDDLQRPIGLIMRSDLVSPVRRRVILVDHAEQAQSVPGIENAEIVEILDHHHIGSIETRVPVLATFDPVGSTSTLVVERFRRSGLEPTPETAMLLLGAILSDTVILNSPTTTDRDHAVVEYLGRILDLDPPEFGREMFASTSDVSAVSAEDLVRRDAKNYQSGSGQPFTVAQVEVVGKGLLERKQELLDAMAHERVAQGSSVYALMVTDVLDQGTDLLVDGDVQAVARAFGVEANGGSLELPGVMSRKKQVAPKLLSIL